MKMFKKNKKDNGIMSELDNNPFMKQILFFGFYFVFFVVLILLLRTGYKNNNRQENRSNNSGYNYDYKLDRLNNQNYHFVYKEMVNGVATIYEGDISDGKMLFSKSGQVATTYFMRNDKFYVKDNNLLTWSETTNPLLFYKFTRPENLHSFIKKSTYVSKTDFIGVKKNDYLLIWRDPILRDANVRYMKVERCDDPNLTGIAINPVMAKGFDGDFDGDTVAVVKIDAEKYKDVHEEAIDKFSVKYNLRDEGKTDEPLFINTGLDLVSVEKVNKLNDFSGFKDMNTVEEIDKALQSVFENDYYLDNAMIKLADDKSVIGSLEKIRDSGAKKGDLDNYIRYFNNTENSETPLPDSERIKVQKATAIKAAVGVAGRYSQQLMRAFRDEFPKAVLELTYPNTQALLQAKHDPERAVEVYKILQDSLFVEFNKDMRKILSPEEEEELKKRTVWIKDIYNKLGQPIGDGGIKESYLDQICEALDYNSLKGCHGSILDECAYGHLDLDDYEYEEPDEDTLKPIAYLSNAGELLSYNPSLEEGKESFCKSFFDEWMKSK